MDDSAWFWVIAGIVVAVWIFQMVRHRGFRGAMYGAEVSQTVGMLTLNPNRLAKSTVKVHRLSPRDPAAGPNVGMELGFSSVLGAWEMRPVALTKQQAKDLSKLLGEAAE